MEIIKEYCPQHNRVILRMSTYGKALSQFEQLFWVAQKDFPGIDSTHVEIIHYGGNRYAKTFGIEFNWYMDIPEEYNLIHEVEYTL